MSDAPLRPLRQWSVDEKSYELAEHFAQGENFSEEELKELSQQIQYACEDFLNNRPERRAGVVPTRTHDEHGREIPVGDVRRYGALGDHSYGGLCSDCPPLGYPTDKMRCAECPRREQNNG